MSSNPSVNADTIEQTKQQIRGLVSEIAQLSKSDLGAEEYYAAFLQRIVSALAAVGGAVWMLGDGRRPELRYQINLSETLLDSSSDEAARHYRLLGRVVAAGEPQLIPKQSGPTDDASAGNPTNMLLVVAPLTCDGQIEGLVEIFQRPDAQPSTQRGYLRFLIQMCELASEWLKSQKLKVFSDRHSLWAQADHFARLVHESLDVRETSYTVVNEGRRLIGCDRVSVAIKRGNRCTVEAISGQDAMENRSNIVTALNKLATKVVATEEPLWYTGSTEDLPPQVEHAIEDYVEESYAKTLTVLPMRRPKTAEERTNERAGDVELETNEANEVIGALIVEQIETDLPREVLEPRIDLVYEHTARSLSNALDHNSILFMPFFRTLGKASVIVKARNLPKTLAVAAAVIAVGVCLAVIPADFDMKAKGALQPVERRDVFAATGGRVERVLVKDKADVEEGDVLVELVNEDLQAEFERVNGQLLSTVEQLNASRQARLNDRGMSEYDRIQLNGKIKELTAAERSIRRQRELLVEKQEHLKIASPIKGQVILNWDVEKSLLHRTVEAGQVIMSVADLDKDWEVELFMPERRSGHVNTARANIKPDLDVTYILATDPGNEHNGSVKHVHGTTQMHEQDGSTVRMRIKINKENIEDRRPGANVTGKVKCGTAPLGYTWFHEVWEWVETNLLF